MPKFRKATEHEFEGKPSTARKEKDAPPPAQQDGQEFAAFYGTLVNTATDRQRWASEDAYELATNSLDGAQEHRDQEGHHQDDAVTVIPPLDAAAIGPKEKPIAGQILISEQNVGYKLLQKHGWTPGTGIGAQEQGRQEPIQPEVQPSKTGLGFPQPKKSKQKESNTAAGTTSKGIDQPGSSKRELPEDPLDAEDIDTKVKRVRQVMQTEADDKAGKEISRYIYSAFRDATGEPTLDTNPLTRKNNTRLSKMNPLL